MIAAGHETTAHTLSWSIERLRRHPELLRRLVEEVDAGGKALREATIREVQRVRPVISFAGRFVREPYELGGYRLPIGTRILLAASLTHADPMLFPLPQRFDPDRFLEGRAGHIYLDPVRRRTPPLHRRDVRAHGGRRRPADDAPAGRARGHDRARREVEVPRRGLGTGGRRTGAGDATRDHLSRNDLPLAVNPD